MFFLTFQSDVLKQSLPVSQSEPHVHSTQFWWVTFNCSQCANNNEQLEEVITGSDVIVIQLFSSTMLPVKVYHCDLLCLFPVLKSVWTSSSLCLLCSCLLRISCYAQCIVSPQCRCIFVSSLKATWACSLMTSHQSECRPSMTQDLSPGAVARACNPSSREAEAGGSFELRTSELQRTMSIGCPH